MLFVWLNAVKNKSVIILHRHQMKYRNYVSFYKSLCNDLRRRYYVRKELIFEAASESIEKNLHRIDWEKSEIIDNQTYDKIFEDARNSLRRILKNENKFTTINGKELSTDKDLTILSFEDEISQRLLIERVTASLPKLYKEMVTLYFLGYKYQGIADKLGLKLATVKKRFERLKQYLKNRQKDYE